MWGGELGWLLDLMKFPWKTEQFLLADSAYKLTQTVIPAYKAPAAYQASNAEFNFRLAKSRVRNEHTIGMLKSRFASLKELRLHLYKRGHMVPYIKWIYSCMILHNMLAELQDTWESLYGNAEGSHDPEPIDIPSDSARNFRARVKQRCLRHFGKQ